MVLIACSLPFYPPEEPPNQQPIVHREGTIKRYDMTYEHMITYHIFDTNREGKNVVIIGGIHGNEPAGWQAAAYLVENFNFSSGRFLIIPKANPLAIYRNVRTIDGLDLNRHFLGDSYGNIAHQIAAVITYLIEQFNPCLIIDLHEAISSTLANSIGHNPCPITKEAAHFAVGYINTSIYDDLQRPFRVLIGYGPIGSVRNELFLHFNVPVFLIETSRPNNEGLLHNPVERRIAQHVFLINALLYFYGVY